MNEKNKKIDLIEIGIPFIYIFAEYEIAGCSLLWLLIIFLSVYTVAKYGIRRITIFRPLLLLFMFMFFHDAIKCVYSVVNYGMLFDHCLLYVFVVLMTGRVDEEKLFKVWSVVSIVVLLGIILHSYQVYFLHLPVTQIKILPFSFADAENAVYAYPRPRSIFSEPAACVSWLAPSLAYMLNKGRLKFSIVLTIGMLLTTSSVGVVMVAVLWTYTLFEKEGALSLNRKIYLLLIIGVFVWLLFSSGIFSDTLTKISNISFSSGSDYSRVLLGVMLFINAPLNVILWGIKESTVADYLRSGSIQLSKYHLSTENSYLGFVNALGSCILYYGIIGLALFINFYYRLFKTINKSQRGYYLICIVSIISQSAFFNSYFVMQMAILLGTASFYPKKREWYGE